MKKLTVALILLAFSAGANAAFFDVQAKDHSYAAGSGSGLDTGLFFGASDTFSVFVNPLDLWSAGPLPRWSNAEGLGITTVTTATGELYAQVGDESGEAPGTLIGDNIFGVYSTADGTFDFGRLVGRVGTGSYFDIGLGVLNHVAGSAGNLHLFYWDSNSGDNANSVLAIEVHPLQAIPEPEIYAMMAAGLGLMGFVARRRKQQLSAA